MANARRGQKEMNETRELIYTSFGELVIPEHKFLGRTSEGLVYENAEGLAIVLRVITKQLDFLAEEEIEDFEAKAQAKIDKENVKAQKLLKIKATKEELIGMALVKFKDLNPREKEVFEKDNRVDTKLSYIYKLEFEEDGTLFFLKIKLWFKVLVFLINPFIALYFSFKEAIIIFIEVFRTEISLPKLNEDIKVFVVNEEVEALRKKEIEELQERFRDDK